ncbi:hypothetical protein [Sphaerospermopsis sp. LEGE 00249]|uniref:hypothetical protein n=1 Tax=Sphaerospermopsis sp. LEGE 00249 TaxID=1380707 RepID=UPI002106AF20|nr:hypothetical protein [Sphaerospermopsis sp. LEGE 00249]
MENQLIDMRLAVSALLETATHHQRNFETMQRNFDTLVLEIRDMRSDMMQMQSEIREIQMDVRGLQTENRRILDILQNRPPEQES